MEIYPSSSRSSPVASLLSHKKVHGPVYYSYGQQPAADMIRSDCHSNVTTEFVCYYCGYHNHGRRKGGEEI